MKYAHYDNVTRQLLGWYDKYIHTSIPTPNIEVNDTDWQDALKINANHITLTNELDVVEFRTSEEIYQDSIPSVVTMRQARLALHQSNLLILVQDTITNGTDDVMKIEWEYATEVRRDLESLIVLATSLGLISTDLDNLFKLAITL